MYRESSEKKILDKGGGQYGFTNDFILPEII
jgi:hypothetical protein